MRRLRVGVRARAAAIVGCAVSAGFSLGLVGAGAVVVAPKLVLAGTGLLVVTSVAALALDAVSP